MATGNSGIATRTDANNKKPGSYSSDLKRCITKASAISAGFLLDVACHNHQDNRLVRTSYLIVPQNSLYIRLKIDISSDSRLYNRGPLTLNRAGGTSDPCADPCAYSASGLNIEDIREIESSEISQNDNEILPLSEDEETLLDNVQTEESSNEQMSLMNIDEVLQIADEYEKSLDNNSYYAAGAESSLITLTKDGGTNLLTSTSYGPAPVLSFNDSSRYVIFTLISKTISTSSDYGSYTLSHPGSSMIYLKNIAGTTPTGGLYYGNTTSAVQSKTISVTGPGIYTFDAKWIPNTTPTATGVYTRKFELRFVFETTNNVNTGGYIEVLPNQLGIHYLYVAFECNIYNDSNKLIKSCSLPATVYNINEIPLETVMISSPPVERYYSTMGCLYQDNNTDRISYVNVKSVDVKYKANDTDNWITPTLVNNAHKYDQTATLSANNWSASGVTGLPTTGTNYETVSYDSNPNNYSMDYCIYSKYSIQ